MGHSNPFVIETISSAIANGSDVSRAKIRVRAEALKVFDNFKTGLPCSHVCCFRLKVRDPNQNEITAAQMPTISSDQTSEYISVSM